MDVNTEITKRLQCLVFSFGKEFKVTVLSSNVQGIWRVLVKERSRKAAEISCLILIQQMQDANNWTLPKQWRVKTKKKIWHKSILLTVVVAWIYQMFQDVEIKVTHMYLIWKEISKSLKLVKRKYLLVIGHSWK